MVTANIFTSLTLYRLIGEPRQIGFLAFWQQHFGHSRSFLEHGLVVERDHHSRRDGEEESIPGLRVGPQGAVHLEVKQEGDQQATPGCIEQGCQDHRDGDHPKEIRSESPGALGRATDQESRNMPDGPDETQDQPGPEGGKPALEQR